MDPINKTPFVLREIQPTQQISAPPKRLSLPMDKENRMPSLTESVLVRALLSTSETLVDVDRFSLPLNRSLSLPISQPLYDPLHQSDSMPLPLPIESLDVPVDQLIHPPDDSSPKSIHPPAESLPKSIQAPVGKNPSKSTPLKPRVVQPTLTDFFRLPTDQPAPKRIKGCITPVLGPKTSKYFKLNTSNPR